MGGAAGDALGGPVEFESLEEIRSIYGPRDPGPDYAAIMKSVYETPVPAAGSCTPRLCDLAATTVWR